MNSRGGRLVRPAILAAMIAGGGSALPGQITGDATPAESFPTSFWPDDGKMAAGPQVNFFGPAELHFTGEFGLGVRARAIGDLPEGSATVWPGDPGLMVAATEPGSLGRFRDFTLLDRGEYSIEDALSAEQKDDEMPKSVTYGIIAGGALIALWACRFLPQGNGPP